MSDAKYQPTDELRRRIASLRKWEATLADRMNRYGPDFWHHKLNGCRIRIRHMEAVIAGREATA
ncbi:hypothetical protein NKI96_10540 [Mesorhizobium sp. M0292]|uniref:hypothetical protein n=1 Tax=Mesorhizobium sp. M0292 TaxID=2956929 RepID=UPI00333B6514